MPDGLQQAVELAWILEVAIMLARFRPVYNHVFCAQRFQLPHGVRAFLLRSAVQTRAYLITEPQRHTGSQAGFKTTTHLRNLKPRIQPKAQAAGSKHAALR